MEKVSVIMPTYGKPEFLDQSIRSVQNQTYSEWELIVVDDNNPETEERRQTEKLMRKYEVDKRIRYIKHEHNMNGSAARNTGIAAAMGGYIAFLDSDDEYAAKRLERCVRALSECSNPKYKGAYTGCEIVQNGKIIRRRTEIQSGNFIKQTLAAGFPLSSGSNLFMRADVVRELKGFDTSFRRHQDYEFLVRYFRKYSLLAIPEILLIKNEIGVNRQNTELFYKTKIQYLNKYKDDIMKLKKSEQTYIYAEHYLGLQSTAFCEHKIKQCFYFTGKAFVNRPFYTILRTCKLAARTVLGRNGKINA